MVSSVARKCLQVPDFLKEQLAQGAYWAALGRQRPKQTFEGEGKRETFSDGFGPSCPSVSRVFAGSASLPLRRPQNRGKRPVDLTPRITATPTHTFPQNRPDGTLPPRRLKPTLTCQPGMGCPTPSPAPSTTYEFSYDDGVPCYTRSTQSYAEMYYNGALGHQTYYGSLASDGSLPIKCVGAKQTVTASLIAVASIPIDTDFTVGNLTAHVYSSTNTAAVWDESGNTMSVSYNNSANRYVLQPPDHTAIVVLPPGSLPPGAGCILEQIAALAYLAMVHAELDAWADYVCSETWGFACSWAYAVAEEAFEYVEEQVDNWLQRIGCGGYA